MKTGAEPMQQPIRKTVGRPPTPSRRLAHLEDLAAFLKKHSHGAFAEPRETTSRFEKLLAALVTNRVDFAWWVAWPSSRALDTGSVRILICRPPTSFFLKQDSWREKDKLDVLALREILAREGGH